MEITEVRVFLANEDRLKAYVTVTFDKCFVVRDLKVIKGNSGLFVAMPSKKKKDGTYKDIAHPIHSEFRKQLEEIILSKFQDEISQYQAQGHPSLTSDEYEDDTYGQDRGGAIERVSTREPQAVGPFSSFRESEAGIGPAGIKK